jgi:hypothetical protein
MPLYTRVSVRTGKETAVTSFGIRVTVSLLSAIALAACVASTNPIGPDSEAVGEPRLVGLWVAENNDKGSDYIHILPAADSDKKVQVFALDRAGDGWAVLDGYVSAVGERRFVNLRLAAADPGTIAEVEESGRKITHPYSFVAYAFAGDDRLSLSYPLELLQKAVKEGRLAGETVGDYDVLIADSSANIAAVLGATGDADLFKEPIHYRRISLPAP